MSEPKIRVSQRGTRGARMPSGGPLMALFRFFMKRTIRSYRKSGGAGISKRMGFPVVLLTTRGAKSNQERPTPLAGIQEGPDAWLVVAAFAGAARHPAWFLSMAAHPNDVWLEVGTKRFKVQAETLDGEDRAEAIRRIAAISPRPVSYQPKTDREIPIVRLTRED